MNSEIKFKFIEIKNSIIINLNYCDISIDDINYNNLINIFNIHKIKINLENNNLCIYIPENLNLNQTIYLTNQKKFKHNIKIIIGANSKISIIDHKQTQDNLTEIIAQDNTNLSYYLIQENDRSQLYIQQYGNSLCNFLLLASNSNNNLNAEISLVEPEAQVKFNILQKVSFNYENHINLLIKHLNNKCYSNTLSRIIVDEQAKCSFIGKIVVSSNGKDTNANLQSKGLILSKQASINNNPELVIDNNEVICSHGASIGNLQQEALFYLQTRGLSRQEATSLLITAFQQPILQSIKYQEILDLLLL